MDLHLWQGLPFCHQPMTQFLQRITAIGDQLPDKYLGTRHNLTLQPGLVHCRGLSETWELIAYSQTHSQLTRKRTVFPHYLPGEQFV